VSAEPLHVRAVVLHEARRPLVVEEVLLDPPRADEVLVRVAAAGVCHSDLHLADGDLGTGRWPTVLGHEGAGVVEATGPGVVGLSPGDRVALSLLPACRRCRACLAGRFHLCETAAARSVQGTLLDGTSRLRLVDGRPLQHFNFVSCFAERCVVPAASAVPVPPELPLWQASLLGCSVLTGVGAVRNTARVALGQSVCVIGCGGVGLQVIAAARLAGAGPIVAVDREPAKLELAQARGATHAVDAAHEDAVAAVGRIVPGGVDHAFEAVGRPDTIRQGWDVLRPGATLVVVGVVPPGIDVCLPGSEFLAEKGVRGCFYGSAHAAVDLPMVARLALDGRLELAKVVSHLTTLDGIDDAFERLRRREGARTVVVVDSHLAGSPERPATPEV
jgi:S-(hydroxymethyl)glutathione dehydrogenase / alcohol dehydrogenase